MEVTKANLLHDEKLCKKIKQAEIVQAQLRELCSEEEFFQASKKLEADIATMKADLLLTDSDLASFFDSFGDAIAAAYCRLHYIHGFTWTEMATFLGKTGPAIKQRCYRVLKQKGIA